MSIYTVEVTQEDIDGGISDTMTPGEFCPVERALSRAIGKPFIVGWHFFSPQDNRSNHGELPKIARDWIIQYGHRPDVSYGTPFTFEVEF